MAACERPERSRVPLEREPANGIYRGRLTVRTLPPGVCGEPEPPFVPEGRRVSPRPLRGAQCANLGCRNQARLGSKYCARCAARRTSGTASPRRCGLCGRVGHNQRTCGRAR